MAIPRTGQLGAASLGSLKLGAPTIWAGTTPSTQRASSTISVAGPSSAMSVSQPRSTISSATPRGGVR